MGNIYRFVLFSCLAFEGVEFLLMKYFDFRHCVKKIIGKS